MLIRCSDIVDGDIRIFAQIQMLKGITVILNRTVCTYARVHGICKYRHTHKCACKLLISNGPFRDNAENLNDTSKWCDEDLQECRTEKVLPRLSTYGLSARSAYMLL